MNLILFETVQDRYVLAPEDPRAQHMSRVLRVCEGDAVRIGAINGPSGVGTIGASEEGQTVIQAVWTESMLPPLPLEVMVGHPRPPVLQRLCRDLASMNVARISIFGSDLGERTYRQSSVWNTLEHRLRDGLSQGRHTALPALHYHHSLDQLLRDSDLSDSPIRWYGALDSEQALSFHRALELLFSARDEVLQLCIGPERGFSQRELTLLEAHSFLPVSLGRSILRTETAVAGFCAGIASVLCGFSPSPV